MNTAPPSPPPLAANPPAFSHFVPPRFPFALMFVVWLMTIVVATLVTFILPESFASTARIKVEPRGALGQTPTTNAYDPHFIPTELEIIQSETILGRVIEVLNLNEVWARRYLDGGKLKTSETLDLLRARVKIRPVPNTTVLVIRVYSELPKEAADLANGIADAYRQWRFEQAQVNAGGVAPNPLKMGPVMILERAVASTKPARPNKPLNLLLGFVFGGVISFSLAMLVYMLKHSTCKRALQVAPANTASQKPE